MLDFVNSTMCVKPYRHHTSFHQSVVGHRSLLYGFFYIVWYVIDLCVSHVPNIFPAGKHSSLYTNHFVGLSVSFRHLIYPRMYIHHSSFLQRGLFNSFQKLNLLDDPGYLWLFSDHILLLWSFRLMPSIIDSILLWAILIFAVVRCARVLAFTV